MDSNFRFRDALSIANGAALVGFGGERRLLEWPPYNPNRLVGRQLLG